MRIRLNTGVEIELEDSGGSGPVLLLLMGLGGQLIHWPPQLVQALVDEGWRVLRPDNRDAGLSTHFDALGVPNISRLGLQAWLGRPGQPPYPLVDMAADMLGVLDALGLQQVHVAGISMGAMIAQRLALLAPQRVLSLSSIMGCSGQARLMKPRLAVWRAAWRKPRHTDPAAQLDYALRFFTAIASPRFPPGQDQLMQALQQTAARHFPRPDATARQMAAVICDGERRNRLGQIRCPTLVLHGSEDPLLPPACGQDTARCIPGAQLHIIPDMGHDLVPAAHPEIVRRVQARLLPFLQSVRDLS